MNQVVSADRNLSWTIFDRDCEYGESSRPVVRPTAEVAIGTVRSAYPFGEEYGKAVRREEFETLRFTVGLASARFLAALFADIYLKLKEMEEASPIVAAGDAEPDEPDEPAEVQEPAREEAAS